jgi:enoyl-CoA hydratase/carnithine racemase
MIQRVLQDDYVRLEVERYTMAEEVGEDSLCNVTVELRPQDTGKAGEAWSGTGVGFVDALYHGLVDHYAPEYPSLRTITFTGFEVTGHMNTGHSQGTDAECLVTLLVNNTEERVFRFEHTERSLVAAALKVVMEAAEYFINSERAYVTVYRALCNARERNRPDLLDKYAAQLAELVKTTSYSEVIERIKSDTN